MYCQSDVAATKNKKNMSIETQNRIAELNKIISESFKDTSVTGAGIWFKAINERSELLQSGK